MAAVYGRLSRTARSEPPPRPPIHVSAKLGHVSRAAINDKNIAEIRKLIEEKMDPNQKLQTGETVLTHAVKENHVNMSVLLIVSRADVQTALHSVVTLGNHKAAQWLLDQRANPCSATADGETVLQQSLGMSVLWMSC